MADLCGKERMNMNIRRRKYDSFMGCFRRQSLEDEKVTLGELTSRYHLIDRILAANYITTLT